MKNKHSLDPYPIPKDKTPMFINEQHMAEIYDFEIKKDSCLLHNVNIQSCKSQMDNVACPKGTKLHH